MSDDEQIGAVEGLATGDLGAWRGLPARLDDAALAAALGAGGEEEPGLLGGLPATYRTYPPAAGAPFGVKAWFDGDRVIALEVREPPLLATIEAQLGSSEADAPSGLGPSYRQHVWGTRGLALHVNEISGEVRRLYGFPAGDAAAFLDSPLGTVEVRRFPRR